MCAMGMFLTWRLVVFCFVLHDSGCDENPNKKPDENSNNKRDENSICITNQQKSDKFSNESANSTLPEASDVWITQQSSKANLFISKGKMCACEDIEISTFLCKVQSTVNSGKGFSSVIIEGCGQLGPGWKALCNFAGELKRYQDFGVNLFFSRVL